MGKDGTVLPLALGGHEDVVPVASALRPRPVPCSQNQLLSQQQRDERQSPCCVTWLSAMNTGAGVFESSGASQMPLSVTCVSHMRILVNTC